MVGEATTRAGTAEVGGGQSTQGHLSPRNVGVRCADLLRNREKKSSRFNQNNPPGPRAYEYSAACGQLRSRRAHLGDCGCVTGARLCRHTRAPPPAWEGSCHGELGGLFCEAAEAQEGAAGLIIPKNAAEEQKLKLERLMKNPVRRGAG